MIITDLWSLHYECFVVQIDGTPQDAKKLLERLYETFPKKTFYISLKGGNVEDGTSNRETD